jgi:uncharacterized membrane protein YfhO
MSYPGRFLLYGRVHTVKDDKEMKEKLLDRSIDLRQELVILSKDGIDLSEKNVKGRVRLLSYNSNKVSFECETQSNAFLYVSDAYYPGWKAYLDGKEARIYRANLAFRAIYIPRGTHTVLFVYRPLSFYVGCCLTVFGLLASLFLLTRRRGRTHG